MMIFKSPILETERLVLKPGSYEDYAKVYEYDMTKLRDINGEFVFVKQDPEKIKGYDKYAQENENIYDWIIYLKETKEPIGNIFAEHHDTVNNSNEIGFNLHPNYWGKGYIKEASISVLEFLFSKGYSKVYCEYDEGNIKSKKVQEKIGFIHDSIKKNAWIKNGIPITSYKSIMTAEYFSQLYGDQKVK